MGVTNELRKPVFHIHPLIVDRPGLIGINSPITERLAHHVLHLRQFPKNLGPRWCCSLLAVSVENRLAKLPTQGFANHCDHGHIIGGPAECQQMIDGIGATPLALRRVLLPLLDT